MDVAAVLIMHMVIMMTVVMMRVMMVVAAVMDMGTNSSPNDIKAHGPNHRVACTFKKAGDIFRRACGTCHKEEENTYKSNGHEGLNDGAEKGDDNAAFQF